MKRILCTLLCTVLAAPPLPAWAGGCYRSSYYRPSYYYESAPYVAPVAVASYFTIPLFSVGYVAPPTAAATAVSAPAAPTQAAGDPACEAKARALEARIASLERLLAPGQAPAGPASLQAPAGVREATASGGWTVVQTKCASCHNDAIAPAKGKGIVLIKDGQPVPLDLKLSLDCLRVIDQGSMPKNGPRLSDIEAAEFAAYIYSLHSPSK